MAKEVFHAKIRIEMEATDYILKKIMGDCVRTNSCGTPRDVFNNLTLNYQNQFWHEFPGAMVIIMAWAQSVSSQETLFFEEDMKTKIWKSFLSRLSLDSWMIMGKNQNSNGNLILNIMVDVIQDTIYSQLPLRLVTERPRSPPPPPIMTSYPDSGRSIFDRFRDSSLAKSLPNESPAPLPPRTDFASIPEEGSDDEELKHLQSQSNRHIYVPAADHRGFPVKIKRLAKPSSSIKEVSNKSRSRRKKSNKKSRAKKVSDDEESEDDYSSDEEE